MRSWDLTGFIGLVRNVRYVGKENLNPLGSGARLADQHLHWDKKQGPQLFRIKHVIVEVHRQIGDRDQIRVVVVAGIV